MTLNALQNSTHKQCLNCKNALLSETSESGLRCGQTYFSLPALKRKPAPLNTYPVVEEKHHCEHWGTSGNELLTRPLYPSCVHQTQST